MLRVGGFRFYDYASCAYGTAYQKLQRLASTVPLDDVCRGCCCGPVPHERLEGKAKLDIGGRVGWHWKTALPGRYPAALCRTIADSVLAASGPSCWRGVGEPLVHPHWRASLSQAVSCDLAPRTAPECPADSGDTEWSHAVGFALEGPSRLARQQYFRDHPRARRQLEERLPLTGTLTAKRAALLSTSVSGLVTTLNVDLGDRVEQGDVLLELDAELNRLALEGARAAAAEANDARGHGVAGRRRGGGGGG